jgi:hypothetical protein
VDCIPGQKNTFIFYTTFGAALESSQLSCLGEMRNLFSRQSGKGVKIKYQHCLALCGMLLGPWKQLLQQETETET